MGKSLFIVRHAIARSTEAGKKDIDRLLSSEGLQQSSRLGAYLVKNNVSISAIICSSASRALQTAELIADQLNFDIAKIHTDEELYEASVRIIFNKIADLNADWNEIILVGHNPVLSYFVEYLTGHHFEGMEPGSLVKISSTAKSWTEISQDNSTFEYYVVPEDYLE